MERLENLALHRDPTRGISRVARHADQEDLRYVLVLSGNVELIVGQTVHHLSEGTSLLFNPRLEHSLELISESAEIAIVRNPKDWIHPDHANP